MTQPFEIDSSRMPLRLGSALRVPDYAFSVWGITGDEAWLHQESDRQYEIEWKGGSPQQMKYVVEAITESGLGNYSQMLRDVNAEEVCRVLKGANKRLKYLELGAGVSTVNVYQKLIDEGLDPQKLFGTLVEPSTERSESTAAKLEEMGLKRGEDFTTYVARDTDVPDFLSPSTMDIASYVAVLHHHAYLDTPLRAVYGALRPGGKIIIADWHNAMWEHPARVYEFLKGGFDWPTKDQDLAVFVQAYPNALKVSPSLSPLDEGSNRNIKKFWQSWVKVRAREVEAGTFKPEDDILMLEAHRPVERQNEVLGAVGFTYNEPKRLIEDAGILYVTVGEKSITQSLRRPQTNLPAAA